MAFLTALAIGSVVASTVMSARAQHQAGKETKRVADLNAEMAEQQGIDAERRAEEEAGVYRREVGRVIGSQKAGYAGQGVDVNVGSPQQMRESTEALARSDLLRIRRNAQRAAQGFKVQAEDYRQQGKYAQSAAKWGVASTILGGATQGAMLAHRYGWLDGGEAAGTTSTLEGATTIRSRGAAPIAMTSATARDPSDGIFNTSNSVRRPVSAFQV